MDMGERANTPAMGGRANTPATGEEVCGNMSARG